MESERAQVLKMLNTLANEPSVAHALMPGYRDIDLSGFFDNENNVAVATDNGAILFGHLGDGVYDAHYLLTDRFSGQQKLLLCRFAIATLFTETEAKAIVGFTPRDNMPARMMNRALGLTPFCDTTDTLGRSCIGYKLEKSQWAILSAVSSGASVH